MIVKVAKKPPVSPKVKKPVVVEPTTYELDINAVEDLKKIGK